MPIFSQELGLSSEKATANTFPYAKLYQKLPVELLSSIFGFCIMDPIIIPPPPHSIAIAIAKTCRLWRYVLLQTPNLWCNIFLDFTNCSKPLRLVAYAKHWLSQSESLITLRNSTSRWAERLLLQHGVDIVQELVVPFASRYRQLDLRFVEASIDDFFCLPSHSITNLEVLSLETLGPTVPFRQPLDVFQSAPQLRRVLISTDMCSIDPAVLGLPWAQLTALHLIATYILPLAMHSVFQASPNLEECSCSIIQSHAGATDELEKLGPCTLKKLRVFMVEFAPSPAVTSDDYVLSFLRPLTLPALVDLELRPLEVGFVPIAPFPYSAYCALVSRSHFSLRRLAILNYSIASEHLVHILSGMPSLKSLQLYFCETSEWDANVLAGIKQGTLIPHLESLTFSVYPVEGILETLEERVRLGITSQEDDNPRVALVRELNMEVAWRLDVSSQAMARFMKIAELSEGLRCRAFSHARTYAHDQTSAQLFATS